LRQVVGAATDTNVPKMGPTLGSVTTSSATNKGTSTTQRLAAHL
jgi:hypothetical protein